MHPLQQRRNGGLVLVSLLLAAAAANAQPSGGPYGPIDQVYKIPKAPHVYYVAPEGNAEVAGTSLAAPTTIEVAVAKAITGDAIILRGGTYRTGGLTFNQKIIFQPYLGERPVLKGTEVATGWQPAGVNVWKTSWTKLFPAQPLSWWNRAKEEAKTPLHRFNNDMVFVDGEFLKSAGSVAELDPHAYYIDYATHDVYIGVDPAKHVVEITAHDGALIRTTQSVNGKVSDKKGPVIRGLTITQYARRCIEIEGKKQFGPNDEPTNEPVGPSDPSTYGKEVTGTTLENDTISYCSRVAGWFRGDHLTIRNSLVSDTSTEGIYVIGSSDVLLERNIVRRNNMEQFTGYYPGAVKIFNQSHRVTMRDNLILENPYSNGVWYDVGNRDGVFVNNTVEGALVGFFFEISKGVTVAGNVFVRNGRGSWILNSSGGKVYNNTYVNNPAAFTRTERVPTGDLFDWHSATGPGIDERIGHVFVNNLLVADETYTQPLLLLEQTPAVCPRRDRAQAERIDGNTYVRPATSKTPLIAGDAAPTCAVTYATLADFPKAEPKYEPHSRQLDRTARTVFKGPDIGRYELRAPIPAAAATPADVLKLIGWAKTKARSAGAYLFRK
jgi:parallel beta-helix repeat protein